MILHPQRLLNNGRDSIEVDEEMFDLVLMMRECGLNTQSSCQQDHISLDGIPSLSDYAYVGFGDTTSAQAFVHTAIAADQSLADDAIESAVVRCPGFGNAYVTGEHSGLTPLGIDLNGRWAYAVTPWQDSGWVGLSVYIAFPRALIPKLSDRSIWRRSKSA